MHFTTPIANRELKTKHQKDMGLIQKQVKLNVSNLIWWKDPPQLEKTQSYKMASFLKVTMIVYDIIYLW